MATMTEYHPTETLASLCTYCVDRVCRSCGNPCHVCKTPLYASRIGPLSQDPCQRCHYPRHAHPTQGCTEFEERE
jgi:hypothetical protein